MAKGRRPVRHEYEEIEYGEPKSVGLGNTLAKIINFGRKKTPPPPPIRTVPFDRSKYHVVSNNIVQQDCETHKSNGCNETVSRQSKSSADNKIINGCVASKKQPNPPSVHSKSSINTKLSQFESEFKKFQTKFNKRDQMESESKEKKHVYDDINVVENKKEDDKMITQKKIIQHENIVTKNEPQAEPIKVNIDKKMDCVPLTPHQVRVQRSLENLTVPTWFKDSPSGKGTQVTPILRREPSKRSGWRREPSPILQSPTPTLTRSRRSSPSPSRQYYSSRQGNSPSPSIRSTSSIRPAYMGWRSQEQLNIPQYLQTPSQRLAQSSLQPTTMRQVKLATSTSPTGLPPLPTVQNSKTVSERNRS